MRLPEQKLWDRLARNIPASEGFSLTRIEALFTPGLPDVFCQSKRFNNSCWIELKVAPGWPKTDRGALLNDSNGMRLDQRNWHLNHHNFGGRSFVLIGVTGEDLHMLVEGQWADKINGAAPHELVELDGTMLAKGKHFWREMKGIVS
jgi:hypothetical protein